MELEQKLWHAHPDLFRKQWSSGVKNTYQRNAVVWQVHTKRIALELYNETLLFFLDVSKQLKFYKMVIINLICFRKLLRTNI